MSGAVLIERAAGLDAVLRPRTVAVIGASRDPAKRGHHIVRSLVEGGFAGDVTPVNPAGGELFGLAVARTIRDVSPPADLAVICTPAPTVPAVLQDCAAARVGAAVILAVGFGEAGEDGRRLEAAAIARRAGIRIVGPNTSGLMNVRLGLNLIGVRGVRPGRLALLVQSGNLALQLMTECAARSSAGFSLIIGVGNETDIRFDEYLRALDADDATGAILVHTEGFRDGRSFLDAARAITARKPIVVLKGARSAVGGEAARSHTGAVAGEYAVLHAALRQTGVIEVTRTDELFHVGETLAEQPAVAPGRGIAVLSDGGGHGALAMDTLVALGTPLADTCVATRDRLRSLLGPAAAVGNPVDVAGSADANPRVFGEALAALAADPGVGAVLVVGLFGGYATRFSEALLPLELDAAAAMARIAEEAGIGLVVHSLYAATHSAPLLMLSEARVAVIESLEVACRCVAALAERGRAIDRLRARTIEADGTRANVADASFGTPVADYAVAAPPLPRSFCADGKAFVLEPESRALAAAFGVPFAPAALCSTADDAARAAARFGCPVAMKAVSPAALHKTDAGGVLLGVRTGDVRDGFDRVVASVRHYALSNGIEPQVQGVLIGPMMPPPVGELLVGVRRDPQFGPVLAVAAGGTLVELLDDVALRVLPVDDHDIRELIDDLRVGRILGGARGGPVADIDPIVRLIRSLADCALAYPDLDAIELNPVFVYPHDALALDARAVLRSTPKQVVGNATS